MNEDAILLRRFVEDHVEAAFTELVRRHFPLVHATALRRVGGDAHLAQDVTQTVFIALARKASTLQSHASLAGWLYLSTHHATAEVVRREQRRKQREASAHSMHLASTSDDPSPGPASLRPLLDDALVNLKADDREAVVLRFLANAPLRKSGRPSGSPRRRPASGSTAPSICCRRPFPAAVSPLPWRLSAAH